MITQLYVLGFLIHFGAQHGYLLRQRIGDAVADFAPVKQSAIYYHLEKMEEAGFVTSAVDADGRRPERSVYTVTDTGREEFHSLLQKSLQPDFEPMFAIDGSIFFSDHLENDELVNGLRTYADTYERIANAATKHKTEILPHVPVSRHHIVEAIFQHHLAHYQAETTWARELAECLDEAVEIDS